MQYHEIPCNTMQYNAIPCNTMQQHAIPCNTMQYNAIPCNTMQYHEIPCIINNCWRSVPLPCGQYNGHFCIRYSVIKRYSVIVLYKMHIVHCSGKSLCFLGSLIPLHNCFRYRPRDKLCHLWAELVSKTTRWKPTKLSRCKGSNPSINYQPLKLSFYISSSRYVQYTWFC